ncbi:hypothetical protein [Haloarchaeobius sp. HRN-SO-5]|uniref:hypothetical protein n=1 Tax=Haloarchaeobius sp. HRN-SO-5 TaxID=3446118 RepID=UPI003EBAE8E6
MIVHLWVLAVVARYLKYVPILGWRFSETIVQTLEGRMERDVDVEDVSVDLVDGAPPTGVRIEVTVANELPVDLTVTGLNVRIGYAESGKTAVNLLWSEADHGSPPANVSRSLVESGDAETMSVERYLTGERASDAVHVDGTLVTEAWLDVPSAKRIPLGSLQQDIPATTVEIPS